MATISTDDIAKLSVDERFDLIERLWDSFEPEGLPTMTDELVQELDRRLAEHKAHPEQARTWDEIEADFRGDSRAN